MKLSRAYIRELLFLLLFRREFFQEDEMEDQCILFFERMEDLPAYLQKPLKSIPDIPEGIAEDRAYIQDKLRRILEGLDEIDDTISSISKGWRLNRLGKVELCILRLAVYEILHDSDIPTGVAINEAVVLAKRYSGEDSSRFVNGVLAKLA